VVVEILMALSNLSAISLEVTQGNLVDVGQDFGSLWYELE
jgi:hypothetical protein